MRLSSFDIKEGLQDLSEGGRKFELWHRLAMSDLKLSYRQTFLGAIWYPLSLLIFSVGLAFIFAGFFGRSFTYFLPYVMTGLLIWGLLSRVVTESCKVFTQAAGTISQIDAPLSVHLFRMMERNLLIFLHELVPVVPVVLVFANPQPSGILLFILAIALNVFCGLAVALLLSIFCTRYPDVGNLIGLAMRFMFFLTPIFWIPSGNTLRDELVLFNPFFHAINVARAPLLGESDVALSWVFLLTLTVPLFALALLVFCKFRRSVRFWI